MSLIGLPFYVCAAQMMDIQARFIMSYYNGSNVLPSTEEMLKDTYDRMTKLWQDGYRKRHAHMLGPRQVSLKFDLIDHLVPNVLFSSRLTISQTYRRLQESKTLKRL